MIRLSRRALWGVLAACLAVAGVGAAVARTQLHRSEKADQKYYCPMHPQIVSDRRGTCPICNMNLVPLGSDEAMPEHDEAGHETDGQGDAAPQGAYVCPMHPEVVSDAPGLCPECNMKLVPSKDAQKDPKTICLMHDCPMAKDGKPCPMLMVAEKGEKVECPYCKAHADKMKAAPADGVEGYAAVSLSAKKRQLIGVSTAPAARRDFAQTIRTVGRIAYDPALYQAQQEYLQSLRSLEAARGAGGTAAESAKRLVDSSRLKLRLSGMSDGAIDEMASWEAPDKSLLLADPGKNVWVYAPIYEYELPYVKPGQPIEIEVPAGNRTLSGEVRSVDPVLDAMTRAANMRATVTDPENALRPEMYVNVTIRIPMGEVLAIPEQAVFYTGTRNIVFVEKQKGVFEPRDVRLGARSTGWVEVKSGVAEGENVVTSGNFLIDSESRLKSALSGHVHGS